MSAKTPLEKAIAEFVKAIVIVAKTLPKVCEEDQRRVDKLVNSKINPKLRKPLKRKK